MLSVHCFRHWLVMIADTGALIKLRFCSLYIDMIAMCFDNPVTYWHAQRSLVCTLSPYRVSILSWHTCERLWNPSNLIFARTSRPHVSRRIAQSLRVWCIATRKLERDCAWYCRLPHCNAANHWHWSTLPIIWHLCLSCWILIELHSILELWNVLGWPRSD